MVKLKDLPNSAPKILIVSKAGLGKTTFALTCGEVAQILDLDKGLRVGKKYKDEFTQGRLNVDVFRAYEPNPLTKPEAFVRAKSHLINVANLCRLGKFHDPEGLIFQVLIIDGLTLLANACKRYVCGNSAAKKGAKPDPGAMPSLQQWGLINNEMLQILDLIRAIPISVIMLAHEVTYEDGDNKIVTEVNISGRKLPPQIPAAFDEFWRLQVVAEGAGVYKRVIKTSATPAFACRSRGGLEDGTNINIGLPKIYEILEWPLERKFVKEPPVE